MNQSSDKADGTRAPHSDFAEWSAHDSSSRDGLHDEGGEMPRGEKGGGSPSDQSWDWRNSAGRIMHGVSNTVNDNIVVARYGTIATIALLTGYGIYKTPLFFRFRTVSAIPSDHFARRILLHGRIVRIIEDEVQGEIERPVQVLIRHLSPVGRLQHRAAFDFSSQNSPSARLADRLEKSKESKNRDLLKIEIAGVKGVSHYSNPGEQERQWLRRLAAERTPITCQLLSRRVIQHSPKKKVALNVASSGAASDAFDNPVDPESQQFAVCHLRYRPPRSIFRQDLASVLVKNGRAMVASGMHTLDPLRPTVDGSTKVEDMRKDIAYLESLANDQFEAVKSSQGMWYDDRVREANLDLVGEADFEMNAGAREKVWRWIREKAGF